MRKANKNNKQRRGRSSNSIRSLPVITPSLEGSKTFRFYANAATDSTVTRDCILDLLQLCIAEHGTVALIDSFKINKVTITTASASFAPVAVDLEWSGGLLAKSVKRSASALSVAPAFLSSAPPRGTTASFWHTRQTEDEVLFVVACPTNSILDLSISYVLIDSEASVLVPVASLTLGYLYVKYLDSQMGISDGHFVPEGYDHVFTR